MPTDPFISETMPLLIERELDAIERANDVRILLAVESGSRAWRFPSQDSDYDVRFIYVHRLERYLSIEPPRDVIERPVDGALDINGWDLRKALRLLVKSNAVVMEWLASPVLYREDESSTIRIRSLAQKACFPPALAYHYDRLARRSFDQILARTEAIALKTYCYAFRACLALVQIREFGQAPPMDMPALLAKSILTDQVRKIFSELVDRKAGLPEHGTTPRLEVLDEFIANVLATPARSSRLPHRPAIVSEADALFGSIVLHDGETPGR